MEDLNISIPVETVRKEFVRLMTAAPDYHGRDASMLTRVCTSALKANLPQLEAEVASAVNMVLSETAFGEMLRQTFKAALQEAVAAKAKSITASMSQASLLLAVKGEQ